MQVLASHQCDPDSIPRTWHHMFFEFVVCSCPCSEGFFSLHKTNTSKFQFEIRKTRPHKLLGLNTAVESHSNAFITFIELYALNFQTRKHVDLCCIYNKNFKEDVKKCSLGKS